MTRPPDEVEQRRARRQDAAERSAAAERETRPPATFDQVSAVRGGLTALIETAKLADDVLAHAAAEIGDQQMPTLQQLTRCALQVELGLDALGEFVAGAGDVGHARLAEIVGAARERGERRNLRDLRDRAEHERRTADS